MKLATSGFSESVVEKTEGSIEFEICPKTGLLYLLSQTGQLSVGVVNSSFRMPIISLQMPRSGAWNTMKKVADKFVVTHFSDSAPYVNTFVLVEGSQVLHSLPIELPSDPKSKSLASTPQIIQDVEPM